MAGLEIDLTSITSTEAVTQQFEWNLTKCGPCLDISIFEIVNAACMFPKIHNYLNISAKEIIFKNIFRFPF